MSKTRRTMKRAAPTIRQEITFAKLLEKLENKEVIEMGTLMLEAGFSKTTAMNPGQNLLSKPGWQELLAQIDDSKILARIYGALMSMDNRAALQASDMLLKLKDKYPATKMKFQAAVEERDRILSE